MMGPSLYTAWHAGQVSLDDIPVLPATLCVATHGGLHRRGVWYERFSLPKFEWVQIRASAIGEVERYDQVLCDIDPHRLLLRIQRGKRFYVIDLT